MRNYLVLSLLQLIFLNMEQCWGDERCRERTGYYPQKVFDKIACANCFAYIFPVKRNFVALNQWLISMNGSILAYNTLILADIGNETAIQLVCDELDKSECKRWKKCCRNAVSCCKSQLLDVDNVESSHDLCPKTWDGYSCWDATPNGETVQQICPTFITNSIATVYATKICESNGSWYQDPNSHLEWTNYTKCMSIKDRETAITISMVCSFISLTLLIPAVIIFLSYRSLRKQHRIKLHINLFISFILSGVTLILWDTLVFRNRLNSSSLDSLMHRNTHGCKILYILTRYTRCTNFIWMFLEGYFLRRLIVNAFETPPTMIPFYIVGWGFAWIPVSIYSIIHYISDDESCWVNPFGYYEWIIYIPNLFSLAMNIFYLGDIMRILMTQLTVHPNEPSHYRRAFKATMILIPLFGVQLLFIIYSPPPTSQAAVVFHFISYIITNLQGFFVALIFCFLNAEVHNHLKSSCRKILGNNLNNQVMSPTVHNSSQVSPDQSNKASFIKDRFFKRKGSSQDDRTQYVALQAI